MNLNTGPDGTRRELILRPETENDRVMLEHLLRCELASGFGRHADTRALLHVTVTLAPQSGESRAAESFPTTGALR